MEKIQLLTPVMDKLCIFNPEHDLCLANGDKNFVPPRSALQFADNQYNIMKILYNAPCASVNTLQNLSNIDFENIEIIPWGWNKALKNALLKFGFHGNDLPSDEFIDFIRKMQHRSSFLPLLSESQAVSTIEEVQNFVDEHKKVIMKAAWSGSGRGIRKVLDHPSEKDLAWAKKMIHDQECIIVEPFRDIAIEFALEYDKKAFVGFSLFSSKNGVYKSNILFYDDEIEEIINGRSRLLYSQKQRIEYWLKDNIFSFYDGPLGVDMYIDKCNNMYISEINIRHTMGLVSHAFLRVHPERHGSEFIIDKY